jgi:hypothetical protein
MTTPLFLTTDELRQLTGFPFKAKQIAQLRTMGVAFRLNGHGKPVVTRSAVEGGHVQQLAASWRPAVLQSSGNRM